MRSAPNWVWLIWKKKKKCGLKLSLLSRCISFLTDRSIKSLSKIFPLLKHRGTLLILLDETHIFYYVPSKKEMIGNTNRKAYVKTRPYIPHPFSVIRLIFSDIIYELMKFFITWKFFLQVQYLQNLHISVLLLNRKTEFPLKCFGKDCFGVIIRCHHSCEYYFHSFSILFSF